jgi:endonuclease-3
MADTYVYSILVRTRACVGVRMRRRSQGELQINLVAGIAHSLRAAMVLKRGASASLTATKSPFHTAVTLFDIPDLPSPRRSKRLKLEDEDIEDLVSTTSQSEPPPLPTPSPKRGSSVSPKKAKPILQALVNPHPAPAKWRETYDAIREMRSRISAPVDTMGCDQAQHGETDPKARLFTFIRSSFFY